MTYRRVHLLLGIQTLVVVLVSVNRLGSWANGYVASNEFLRWVDLNNMILALVSLVAFYLLTEHLEAASGLNRPGTHRALGVTFIVGAYLLAASYGSHEVTNYLHVRFCDPVPAGDRLCEVIVTNDDGFSHLLFFAGFTVINVAIMLTQVAFPGPSRPTIVDNVVVAANALFIGLGIAANLGFEEIGFDLYVVAIIAVFAGYLLWRHPRQLVVRYYTVAYVLGLVGTAVAKLA